MGGCFLQHMIIYEVGASWTLTEFARHFFHWIIRKMAKTYLTKTSFQKVFFKVNHTSTGVRKSTRSFYGQFLWSTLIPCLSHDIFSTISTKLNKNTALVSSVKCTSWNWLFKFAILKNLTNFVQNSMLSSGR